MKTLEAVFIENIAEFCSLNGIARTQQELHSSLMRFRKTKEQFIHYQNAMSQKIEELKKGMKLVDFLKKREEGEFDVRFQLFEGGFANSKCKNVKKIILRLGAGVLVEYPLSEAAELLEKNLKTARENW